MSHSSREKAEKEEKEKEKNSLSLKSSKKKGLATDCKSWKYGHN